MYDPLTYRAGVTPGATALIDADRDERWSVADLDSAVERVAGRLAALGVRPGDRLGVLLPTRPAAVRVIHATIRLGAVVVPLGPRLTADELAERLERADATTLVCDATTEVDAVAAVDAADPADATVPVVSVDDAGDAADPDTDPDFTLDYDDPWAADRFLDEIEGSAYGTTPEGLREGLRVVTTRETVWLSPGVPFIVPVFLGLVIALTYGDLLFGLLRAIGAV